MLEGDTQGTEPKDEATAEMELDLEAAVASESAKPEDMDELDLTLIAGEPSVAADAADAADVIGGNVAARAGERHTDTVDIVSGVGSGSYTFIWGMVGENQTFTDMADVPMSVLM